MDTNGSPRDLHVVLVLREAQPNGARARNRLFKRGPEQPSQLKIVFRPVLRRCHRMLTLVSSTITSTGQKSTALSTSTTTVRTDAAAPASKLPPSSPVHLTRVGLGPHSSHSPLATSHLLLATRWIGLIRIFAAPAN